MNIGKTTMEYLYKIGAGSRTKQRLCLPVVVTMLLFGSTASADSDFHITILNKVGEKVSLVFWGASGWSSATNPVKMFTGSDGDAGTADFDPFPGLGGTYDVGHARKGVSALLRGVLWINHNTSLFNKDDARLGLETTVMPRRFLQPRGGYSSSHPFQLVPEFFGNDSDLFVTILDNKHFAWAGILLHNAANDTGKEDWTNTCRSLIYSYYYKYAFRGFLFNPPHGGWYVHSGGGSDDLLWAALAAIGYKELSVKYRNKESMRADVYTHRNLLNGGDSNRRFTKPYTDINTLKSWYAYLDLSGYYYAGIVIPDEWYGIPWKDHSGDVNYKSPLDDQRDSSQHTGLNFRASISNSLFWLYAARLLKHRDELGLGNPEVELLEDTIGNEYGLFFEDHDDLYVCRSNANDPDPAHPVDRIGLIEDGARYPWLQIVDGPSETPKW